MLTKCCNRGFLPAIQKGKHLSGPIHAVDWYSTFIALAGLDPTDNNPLSPSAVDGINQWPWLSGQIPQSLRNVVVLDHNLYQQQNGQALGAIIVGKYKLLIGPQPWASWYWGPQNNFFNPNQSNSLPPSEMKSIHSYNCILKTVFTCSRCFCLQFRCTVLVRSFSGSLRAQRHLHSTRIGGNHPEYHHDLLEPALQRVSSSSDRTIQYPFVLQDVG